MKKLLSRVKKSNKGFTLIELIIVIAIIAVLAAVLAPQYMSYVGKSREAADKSTMTEYLNSVKVALADESTSWKDGDITFTVSGDTVTPVYSAVNGSSTPTLSTTVGNSVGSTFTLKSTAATSKFGASSDATKITITSDGQASWVNEPTWTT